MLPKCSWYAEQVWLVDVLPVWAGQALVVGDIAVPAARPARGVVAPPVSLRAGQDRLQF